MRAAIVTKYNSFFSCVESPKSKPSSEVYQKKKKGRKGKISMCQQRDNLILFSTASALAVLLYKSKGI